MALDKVTVTVVSSSAAERQLIARALDTAPGIEVVGVTGDADCALMQAGLRQPQVLIVDSESPGIDCGAFVRRVMAVQPTPVIICATREKMHAPMANAALAAGAIAVIARPQLAAGGSNASTIAEMVHAVRRAARTRVRHGSVRPAGSSKGIVAIGTSTGGTQALEAILTRLPPESQGIVIVQHMPAVFTAMFAERLHAISQIEVREASGGERVRPGLALIAPGGRHMQVKRNATHFVVEVIDGPLVNRHRPSVDVLFSSVAKCAGAGALGIIMTGMGDDGARGLKEMHDAGATTIAQDEASCVVFGMPNEAIKLGAVDCTLPLGAIAPAIVDFSQSPP